MSSMTSKIQVAMNSISSFIRRVVSCFCLTKNEIYVFVGWKNDCNGRLIYLQQELRNLFYNAGTQTIPVRFFQVNLSVNHLNWTLDGRPVHEQGDWRTDWTKLVKVHNADQPCLLFFKMNNLTKQHLFSYVVDWIVIAYAPDCEEKERFIEFCTKNEYLFNPTSFDLLPVNYHYFFAYNQADLSLAAFERWLYEIAQYPIGLKEYWRRKATSSSKAWSCEQFFWYSLSKIGFNFSQKSDSTQTTKVSVDVSTTKTVKSPVVNLENSASTMSALSAALVSKNASGKRYCEPYLKRGAQTASINAKKMKPSGDNVVAQADNTNNKYGNGKRIGTIDTVIEIGENPNNESLADNDGWIPGWLSKEQLKYSSNNSWMDSNERKWV